MATKKIVIVITLLLVHLSAFAKSDVPKQADRIDEQVTLTLTLTKLSDNQGQIYLGAPVNTTELTPYLAQLKELLGSQFKQYRAMQAVRDHQLFHMTLLSPKEYQLADKNFINKILATDSSGLPSKLTVTLLGLGTVKQQAKQTFFVVAQSDDGQLIRQSLSLKNKDFHVTLGFSPNDIYGVKKGRSTLIK